MDYIKPLRYILEIAASQSISLAAEKLNIKQPALSKYLKKVETELGVELFDRSTNPITLTSAGKCYIETANKIIDADNQLQKQLVDISNQKHDIHIGISPSRASYLLPPIIASYQNDSANIVIYEETTSELNVDLTSGKLDIIISILNRSTQSFECVKLFDESIMLAVPSAFPSDSFVDAFSHLQIISSGKGQLLTDVLRKLPSHHTGIECQNIITSLSLVESGVGATLVPSYIADYSKSENVKFLDIPDSVLSQPKREVCIFYRKEQFLSESEKHFIQHAVSISNNT